MNRYRFFAGCCLFFLLLTGTSAVTAQLATAQVATAQVSIAQVSIAQVATGQVVSTSFAGTATRWHGYDRYDFIIDDSTQDITPFVAPVGEGDGVGEPARGKHRCVIVVPQKAAPGNPWSWQGCYWNHQPQTEIELLRRGFSIAYVSASATLKPGKEWETWYSFLTGKQGLSKRPAFVGMSRGGEYAYIWATRHPDKVSCIYADNPGMNRETLMRLDTLAKLDIPLLHVCGSIDPIFGDNTLFIEDLYQRLGGRISLMVKEGFAHHPHSLRDPRPIADFIEQSCLASGVARPPALIGAKFIRSSYYGVAGTYRYYPEDGAYITCRGPWFADCYDRYSFGMEGVAGSIVITLPKKEAPGKPWVFRAGFGGRDAWVDLALLAKGYAIVTGPVSFNSDSLILKDWNTVYRLLVDQGYSKRPVLEGAGGAAGEVYGWAINNPGKVSCIYGENPLLRTTFSPAQPLDQLALLAKANVSLLQVCASHDPVWPDNGRLLAERYKKLGGTIKTLLKEGETPYPPALQSENERTVVGFITSNTH